ncbi:hypothetical protein IWW34DRAFT_791083 [Fusarium oxysporum f. sp. albedinis]|nr:hypothetical protein IWW34DRAFT_791083 [Fusarium oxysporum f. sp. albedinis]
MYCNAEKAPKHTHLYPEPANTGGYYGLFSNDIESRQKKPRAEYLNGSQNDSDTAERVSGDQAQDGPRKDCRSKRNYKAFESEAESASDEKRSVTKYPRKYKEPQKELACPFFKHSPKEYKDLKTCRTTSWSSLARVKEHIKRCHSPALSKDQLDQLKQRGKYSRTDEEQWKELYSTLFPRAKAVPSPWPSTPSSKLSHFEGHLRREMASSLARELAADSVFESDTLRQRIPQIVQKCLDFAIESYQHPQLNEAESTSDTLSPQVNEVDLISSSNPCPQSPTDLYGLGQNDMLLLDDIDPAWLDFSKER